MSSKMIKPVSLAVGAAFLGSLSFGTLAADGTGMQATDLAQGYMLVGERQSVEYLERLARGVSLSKAQLKWLACGQPGPEWAASHLRHARTRLKRAQLLEWRAAIRRLKLAEHQARVESWERLLDMLNAAVINA